MTVKQIQFLRGFTKNEPISTTLHIRGLIDALKTHAASKFNGNEFTPKMLLPSWLQGTWGMRFARFILYPLQAPPKSNGITHLLDHGYAHVLYTRNPTKTIVTVTDLMPVLWWKGLSPVQSKKGLPITALYSLYALKRATHIITMSSNTKNDLVKLVGCDPSKISIIPHGVDSIFKPYGLELKRTLRNKIFGPEPKKLILISGTQFYKNHETALKTIRSLLSNGVENIYMVKTGNPTQDWLDLVKEYKLTNNILNIGFLPREQMPDIYNSVDVLLFPSLYEGFGWPPLEAMACGTPAVTSNAASLPEIMGNIDTMCDPFDVIGFAKKIQRLLNDEEHRKKIIQQGLTHSAKFTWENTVKKTIDVYNIVDDEP